MADADLSHMGDNVMDTWLESYGRWHCRWMVQTVGVGADNVRKPRRLELPYRKYTLCLPRLHHGGFIVFFQERFLFRNGRACMFFLESNLLYNVTHNVTLWNCV